MSNSFTLTFTAGPEHIDINGHVNNMVWLQWVQDIATAHWQADAPAEHALAAEVSISLQAFSGHCARLGLTRHWRRR